MQVDTEASGGGTPPAADNADAIAAAAAAQEAQEPVPSGEESGEPKPAAAEAPRPAVEAEPEKPKQTPWWQKRIDDITREKHDARREADNLRAQLTALAAPDPATQPDPAQPAGQQPKQMTQAQIDAMVDQRAEQKRQAADFNAKCNETFDKGKADFPDFEQSLANFRLLGGMPPSLIEAALETGEGHKVLYELGKNPDDAARIMQMPPARMAVAVARLAMAPAKQATISKAPAPISPIGSGVVTTADPSDKDSMDAWIAKRNKQLAH